MATFPYLEMVDLHIPTIKKLDRTKDILHPFIFIVIIDTNVNVVSTWC